MPGGVLAGADVPGVVGSKATCFTAVVDFISGVAAGSVAA
jgi:hypothetical protein